MRCSHATHRSMLPPQRRNIHISRATVRFKEFGDAGFKLDAECQALLEELLGANDFCKQVTARANVKEDAPLKFTGLLFEPVPWSPSTPKGMPSVSFCLNSKPAQHDRCLTAKPSNDVHGFLHAGHGKILQQSRVYHNKRAASFHVQG